MNPYLVNVLDSGPRVLALLLGQIPKARWDTPTHPERFTPREVVAHLADWEPVFRERIQAALDQPGQLVEAYDEAVWSIEHGYAQKDPLEQIQLYMNERAKTLEMVRALDPTDWPKSYHHPERGVVTVYDTANMMLGHDLYHLDQLAHVVEGLTAGTW